jgi:hypothetical protein
LEKRSAGCKNAEPLQVIGAADSGFALVEQVVEGDGAMEQLSRQEALDSFDLPSGPLIRGRLLLGNVVRNTSCRARS